MSKVFRIAAAITLAALVSGCAALGGGTPRDTYELSATDAPASTSARRRLQLLVPEPTATGTLNTNQIVVKPTPYTVEALEDSQWGDRLPRLAQLRLVQAFENTGRVGAVGVPGQGLAIDYQVVTELRRFEIDASAGRNTAVVEIAVKVLNDRNGTVRATRTFTASAPVAGRRGASGNAAFVAALDDAFGRVAAEIVTWTLRTA